MFPYVENHNFYIEHWSMGVFWRKMRELGQVLQRRGILGQQPDDMFYLRRDEVRDALFDYGNALGGRRRGDRPRLLAARDRAAAQGIIAALATQPPQPALNEPPEVITEPFTIMLCGHHDRAASRAG